MLRLAEADVEILPLGFEMVLLDDTEPKEEEKDEEEANERKGLLEGMAASSYH